MRHLFDSIQLSSKFHWKIIRNNDLVKFNFIYLFIISKNRMNTDNFQGSFFPSNQQQLKSNDEQQLNKSTCTRCGTKQLIDITHHEFPQQKGLLFECMSCGNNSLQSNVSDDERQRRLAKVAADHLTTTECQFCSKRFYSCQDYLKHLQNDHASNSTQ
ncbi:hypothetical protein I4U23_025551 [Adineta vaga]|nr:hypothetical protein I4U23_025551 [Adineta vaga]